MKTARNVVERKEAGYPTMRGLQVPRPAAEQAGRATGSTGLAQAPRLLHGMATTGRQE